MPKTASKSSAQLTVAPVRQPSLFDLFEQPKPSAKPTGPAECLPFRRDQAPPEMTEAVVATKGNARTPDAGSLNRADAVIVMAQATVGEPSASSWAVASNDALPEPSESVSTRALARKPVTGEGSRINAETETEPMHRDRCEGPTPPLLPVGTGKASSQTGLPSADGQEPSHGDKHLLRTLRKVLKAAGLELSQTHLTVELLLSLLKQYGHREPPRRHARKMLMALDRAVERDAGLQSIRYEKVCDERLRHIRTGFEPETYKEDIKRFITETPVMVPGGANPKDALAPETIDTYVESAGTALAALYEAGIPMSPDVGIAFMAQLDAVTAWLGVVKERAEGSVATVLAAFIRIAGTVPGITRKEMENLEERLSRATADMVVLSAEQSAVLHTMSQPGTLFCLMSTPGRMMREAISATVNRRGRLRRAGAAAAFLLMIEHPGLSPRAIVEFDLKCHVVGVPGARFILVADAAAAPSAGLPAQQPEPMSPRLEALLSDLQTLWTSLSVESTLLWAGAEGKTVSYVMESYYFEIRAALRQENLGDWTEKLKCSTLRDLNVYIGLDQPDADVAAVSRGAGIKSTRSTERRFRDLNNRPKAAGGSR